jgi:para-nitrobenzyl esterase
MSYIPAAQRATVHGMSHGGELTYVFENLPDHDMTFGTRHIAAATPADHRISDAMTAYWAAFAKASDPDSAGGVAWPRYDPATEAVLEFGADGVKARPHFHQATLDLVEQAAAANGSH